MYQDLRLLGGKTMRRIIFAPSRYIQGEKELQSLSSHITQLGQTAFILIDKYILEQYETYLFEHLTLDVTIVPFPGECSLNTVQHLIETYFTNQEVVVGIGGGKTLDTAKVIANQKNTPIIVCPTAASTDAPTSALSVIYSDEGVYEEVLYYKKNPDLVLVDTTLIAKAPSRLLIAGMGDALATFFEMRSSKRANKTVISGGKTSQTAYVIAKACYEILIEKGYIAVQSAKRGVLSPELDDVIEANTYMSGIGFECGGVAVAHGIHDALTVLEDVHQCLHGEKVAFGTICQLVIENAPKTEIYEVIEFCRSVGLPTTLAELGIVEDVDSKIKKVAASCYDRAGLVYNCPFDVNEDLIYATILTADEIGKNYKK